MSDTNSVTVEATGETVGEAKWAALRELEVLVPGLDRDSVEFQVVTEGERGLLGVGFTPAHVIASAAASDQRTTSPDPSVAAQTAREFVQRVAAAIGASVSASSVERDGVVTVTCTGADLGLFIGKHGQTIDAIQYLANAMARSQGDQTAVVVDAAGYRARRTSALETVAKRTAQRASATGSRVELDPMTPVERKIVHEALKDDPEVETSSEGSEPNRYVVVFPRLASG
jgi:spoIIIJ-associated protein